jgi:Flp pilus assembly protein CpaB
MAFGANSKIFSAFITDALNRTAPFDLNADTPKVALFNNTGTPDQTVAAASTAYNTGQWVTANEVSNGGWTAAGLALASITSTFSSNVYTFDAADTANGSAATLAAVFGCLVYDDTITTPVADQGMSYHSFGGTQSVTAGTFTVVWNAAGIITLTL